MVGGPPLTRIWCAERPGIVRRTRGCGHNAGPGQAPEASSAAHHRTQQAADPHLAAARLGSGMLVYSLCLYCAESVYCLLQQSVSVLIVQSVVSNYILWCLRYTLSKLP